MTTPSPTSTANKLAEWPMPDSTQNLNFWLHVADRMYLLKWNKYQGTFSKSYKLLVTPVQMFLAELPIHF